MYYISRTKEKPYNHLNRCKKAYEKIQRPWEKQNTLNKQGINEKFSQSEGASKKNPQIKMVFNGETVKAFLLRSGTRKDSLLMPLSFNMIPEVLA